MAKLTLNNIASGFNTTSNINANNALIETAINNTLSLDGTNPNQMKAHLDMNGFRVINSTAESGGGFIWKGTWVTNTSYVINNLVSSGGASYICIVAHTSGASFATDLSILKWELLAQKGDVGLGSGDLLKSNNLSELTATSATARGNISAAKLGANSDITAISGLTTALSTTQGGTGLAAPGANGNVLTSNGTTWTTTSSTSTPIGTSIHFAGSIAPSGFLKENGAAISRTTYSGLFAVIGTVFGVGDGTTTFNLPDSRGEFFRGLDDGRGVDLSRALGVWQDGQNKSHTHIATVSTSGAHDHTGGLASVGGTGVVQHGLDTQYQPANTGSSGSHTHTVTNATDGGTENRVRNFARLICIKF